jgi:NADPH oxidase 2
MSLSSSFRLLDDDVEVGAASSSSSEKKKSIRSSKSLKKPADGSARATPLLTVVPVEDHDDSRALTGGGVSGVGSSGVPNADDDSLTTIEHAKKTGNWLRWRDVRDWWMADGPKTLIYLLWLAAQLGLGVIAAIEYWNKPNYYVTVARICGAMLNLNCALVLVPVLRNVLTWARKTFLSSFVPFDKNLVFHRHIAWAIAAQGIVHGGAHYFNYDLTGTPWTMAWATLAGSTGHIISLCMLLIYSASWDTVRRRYHNAFFFTHHLFIVFFACLLAHGPRFWYYFLAPGLLYVTERLLREFRGRKMATIVIGVRQHPSDVIELRLQRKRFKYKPGQYLFLNCPYLSNFEWHPFTITSAPEEEFVSVHIRCVGDWTKGLAALLAPSTSRATVRGGGDDDDDDGGEANRRDTLVLNKGVGPDGRTLMRLDGPMGAASEEVFRYRTVLLVGAGIGVTPFASILKSIYLRLQMGRDIGRIEKVYFVWTSRSQGAFEWFQSLLADLEDDLASRGLSELIDIQIFLTGRMKDDEVRSLMYQDLAAADPITRLRAKTNFGRPRFPDIFNAIRNAHNNTRVGVFFCGPRALGSVLKDLSLEYSKDYDRYHTQFRFNKENF